jgi:hypothetical protein
MIREVRNRVGFKGSAPPSAPLGAPPRYPRGNAWGSPILNPTDSAGYHTPGSPPDSSPDYPPRSPGDSGGDRAGGSPGDSPGDSPGGSSPGYAPGYGGPRQIPGLHQLPTASQPVKCASLLAFLGVGGLLPTQTGFRNKPRVTKAAASCRTPKPGPGSRWAILQAKRYCPSPVTGSGPGSDFGLRAWDSGLWRRALRVMRQASHF